MQVIGHRGCGLLEPENTLRGFKKALKLGVDYIELDVHQCLSGELVVIHDDRLERTTNGKGVVYDHTLKELKKLDAGKGEKIPTLDQVLRAIGKKVKLIIELKGPYTEKKVVEAIEKYNIIQSVIVSSFFENRLKRIKKLNHHIRTALTHNRMTVRTFAPIRDDYVQLHIRYRLISAALVNEAHKHGVEIFAWTVNSKKVIQKMVSLGVDGVITDDPRLVRNV